jgi:hypothetical protein
MLSILGNTELTNAVVPTVYGLESADVNLHRKKNVLDKLT